MKEEESNIFDPKSQPPTSSKMFICFLKIAIPAIFTNLMGTAAVVTNGVFAGRMNDPIKLASVGLASITLNLMVTSIMKGLNCAQETLTS